jgi:eukaryotic-like serine/threonine-protein kinase
MIDDHVTGKPTDKAPLGWVRALYDWVIGEPPTTPVPSPGESVAASDGLPARIAHYAISRKLGEGGMGVVYLARDERLERTVALKTMSILSPRVNDDMARKRFWREARAAASVNHPNICQIYEIGEDAGELFIAMELLEGEPLAERLRRGPMSVAEVMPVALGMLAALSALHARGIVHRDLKPSNVFLTPHGVKLLDFGLARPDPEAAHSVATGLTLSGMVVGTPRYMSPEQVTGEVVDARSDLFSAAAVLFEMLAGRPAFGGRTVVEILHATLNEQPPALTGSPAVVAMDRVIRRALSKSRADRPASADEMADELRLTRGVESDGTSAMARALTRIVVLPFRVLRPDPETDFLAFSLPDAIATSLSRIGSLVVRSSATAGRFAGDTPDLKAVATEADVDRVVMGTLLRSGDELRAATQLVEAPSGTLLTSHTVQSSLGDLFALQDDIARRVVAALSLPLGAETPSPAPDAPPNARAYELYLRANRLARNLDTLAQARDLYQEALDLDPGFAPAWAQIGRCHRVIGKFVHGSPDSQTRAEESFRRALELQPRLPVAHKFCAQLEAETGRTREALVRLLSEATRHGNDPELFAGLVHVCRYCGLYDQSIAAHDEARRLDPNVPTSLEQTLHMAGDLERLLTMDRAVPQSGDNGIRIISLGLAGRRDEARAALREMVREGPRVGAFLSWTEYLMAWLDRSPADMFRAIAPLGPLKIQDDPEAIFEEGWLLCDIGELDAGLDHLRRAVAKGYFAAPTLSGSPQFDPLRTSPVFQAVLADAEAGRARAIAAFRDAGGERLLGR